MKDSQGRTIDYMRISITDRCNLRCCYCMPEDSTYMPEKKLLSFEEILTVVRCGAELGIRYIKVTGGEPLVREGCPQLIGRIKKVPGIEKVTVTTNGLLLEKYLDELTENGVDGINISLDTVDRRLYQEITGRDCLEKVLSGIKKAACCPVPVKINTVSFCMGGENYSKEAGWETMAELARNYPVDVRFIEMMPVGLGKRFTTVSHKELLKEIQKRYPGLERDERPHGFGPAVYYRIPGFSGTIGLISAIHGKFCSSCNRVRLTPEGYLKTCLCYEKGAELCTILRGGYDDTERKKRLLHAMEQAIEEKPASHCFDSPERMTEKRNMAAIGG